jgi:hypothetical protein
MRTRTRIVAAAGIAAAWLAASSVLGAQATPAAGKGPYPPAKVDVVIERYQADKKISSMPFSLWVTGGSSERQGSSGSLRIGVDVPIGSTTQTRGSNAPGSTQSDTTTVPQYRNIGTSIDCYLTMTDDGKYVLRVTLNDTSIFDPAGPRQAALVSRGLAAPATRTPDTTAAFRTLQFNNTLQMHDGQTAEFASATDKITGEVVKTQVTLTIAK